MRPYGRVRRCAHAVVRRVTTPYPSTARPRPAKISTAVSRLTVLLVLAPCTIEAPGSLPPSPSTHSPTHPPTQPLIPCLPPVSFCAHPVGGADPVGAVADAQQGRHRAGALPCLRILSHIGADSKHTCTHTHARAHTHDAQQGRHRAGPPPAVAARRPCPPRSLALPRPRARARKRAHAHNPLTWPFTCTCLTISRRYGGRVTDRRRGAARTDCPARSRRLSAPGLA